MPCTILETRYSRCVSWSVFDTYLIAFTTGCSKVRIQAATGQKCYNCLCKNKLRKSCNSTLFLHWGFSKEVTRGIRFFSLITVVACHFDSHIWRASYCTSWMYNSTDCHIFYRHIYCAYQFTQKRHNNPLFCGYEVRFPFQNFLWTFTSFSPHYRSVRVNDKKLGKTA